MHNIRVNGACSPVHTTLELFDHPWTQVLSTARKPRAEHRVDGPWLQSPACRFSDSEDSYVLVVLLWPPCGIGQAVIFSSCGFFFLLLSSFFLAFFFLAHSQPSQIGCLSYFYTWCGLSVNLGCRSEMCCTRLGENTGHKNRKKIAICAPLHNFVGLCLRNWGMYRQSEKSVKQQYLLHMFSQYGDLRLISGWDQFTSLGHPTKFQWVSGFGFVTASTSLNGGQPNFARCLAVSWAGMLWNIGERKTWTCSQFCTGQNSVRGQEPPKMYT